MIASSFTVISEHYLVGLPKRHLTMKDNIVLFGLIFTVDYRPDSVKLMYKT